MEKKKTQDDFGSCLSKAYLVLEAKTQQERDLEKKGQTIHFEVNEQYKRNSSRSKRLHLEIWQEPTFRDFILICLLTLNIWHWYSDSETGELENSIQ